MRVSYEDLAYIRDEAREAMENRARMLTAMGYERVDGEWVDAKSQRPITREEIRTIYGIGDDAVTRLRKSGDSKWPWPSTHVPF